MRGYTRFAYAAVALALLAVILLPAFVSKAFAYGQVTTRSIEMSNSTTDATGVSYKVSFTPASGTPIQDMALDVCSNDPLIGDPCTKPTNFSVGTPTVTGVTVTGQTGGGTWTASVANSNRTLELTNTTAQSGTPTAVTFTLTTAHNPSTLGTFYARVFTFATAGNAATWGAANSGDGSSTTLVLDAGGVALSTISLITITARVQEQLTFCTNGATITANNCANATTAPNLTIGHANASGTLVLDSSAIDTVSAYTATSTNATSGVIVRMKDTTSTACGGLSANGGTSCAIPAANTGTGSSPAGQSFTAGTAAFGVCVLPGSANTTPQAPYDNGGTFSNCSATPAGSQYGLDDTAGPGTGTSAITTYGSPLFSSTGPLNLEGDRLIFAATASNTTPAGTYSVSESLIATGTF